MQPKNTWIFDVDGVLTHPKEKKILQTTLLDYIIKFLQNGEPVAFNSGRSLIWLENQILNPLLDKIQNKKILSQLFIVGEKGAYWNSYSNDGIQNQNFDPSISVPQDLLQKVRTLIQSKFSGTMFFDSTKKTMISIEMKQGTDLYLFRQQQQSLVTTLNQFLTPAQKQTIKIDPTTIATDIEKRHVGKALGTQKIIDWLSQNGQIVDHFYTFGDSPSDLEMPEKLYQIYQEPNKITFIFVGEKLPFPEKSHPFKTLHYTGFDQGTRNFFSTLTH